MHYAPVQKRILAILWLVPIYGFTSWLSLVWPRFRQEMSVVRDCYEAYAVYTFFAFLCEVLKYENMNLKRQQFGGAKNHLPNGDYHAEGLESYVHDTYGELSSCKESEVYSASNVQSQMNYSLKNDHLGDVFSGSESTQIVEVGKRQKGDSIVPSRKASSPDVERSNYWIDGERNKSTVKETYSLESGKRESVSGRNNSEVKFRRIIFHDVGGMRDLDEALVAAIVENARQKSDIGTRSPDGNHRVSKALSMSSSPRLSAQKLWRDQLRPPFRTSWDSSSQKLHRLARDSLYQCRLCTLQFVLLRPVLTILPFILQLAGYNYDEHVAITSEGRLDFSSCQLYVTALMNLSFALAFYGLICFHHATDRKLEWIDPWPKFLSIKGIVFVTFWQGLVINICSQIGFVDCDTAASAQDFLICIEMLLASIVHYYIFPHGEWLQHPDGEWVRRTEYSRRNVIPISLRDNFALDDFANDVRGFQFMRRDKPVDVPLSDMSAESSPPGQSSSSAVLMTPELNAEGALARRLVS